jgi:hypothetical protein
MPHACDDPIGGVPVLQAVDAAGAHADIITAPGA